MNTIVVKKRIRQSTTLDSIELLTMKIKQFRSILGIATVAISIAASIAPAQAFTWDDLWQSVKRGYENAPSSNPPQQSSGSNESPQAGGFNNDAPQQATPVSNPTSQQNNFNPYTAAPQQPNIQRLGAMNCISANGNDFENIDRDSPESNISVGRRPFRVLKKANLGSWGTTSFERTCRILRHPSSEKVRVGYAIPDNSTLIRARVSIYVNGQEKTSEILTVGQAKAFTADIAGASSYAVVVKPLEGYGYIYPIAVKIPQ
jgi:hypothetical protein